MRSIVKWCLARRPVIILAAILILIGGGYGATTLRQQLFPDFDLPFAIITLDAPNLDTQTVDSRLSRPLERAISGISGVKNVTTMASDGRVRIFAELDYGIDTNDKQRDISDTIARMNLPEGVSAPQFAGGFTEQAVVAATVRADDGDIAAATKLAHKLKTDLEQVDGVGRVDLAGGSDPQTLITLSPRAIAQGITAAGVVNAIEDAQLRANIGLMATKQGPLTVVVQGANTGSNIAALKKLVVSVNAVSGPNPSSAAGAASGAGAASSGAVTLGSIAQIKQIDAAGEAFALVNGKPSLTLSVYRKTGSDEVSTVDAVSDVIKQADKKAENSSIDVLYETAKEVRASIRGLIVEGVLGAIFAVVVIFFFLRSLPGTLVAAVSIPTSVVFGLLAAWMLGLTMNLITLAGLTIAIGRVIDDGIVVLENIHKHLERGEPRRSAMINGTGEVAVAIGSSTIATAAVFLPIGLVGGLISEIFLSFSIIVTAALLASLLVAVTIIPVIGSMVLRPAKKAHDPEEDFLARAVEPATAFGIRWRWPVLFTAIASVAAVVAAVAFGAIPTQFLPSEGAALVAGTVQLPPGTSAQDAKKTLAPLDQHLSSLKKVKDVQITYGIESGAAAFDPSIGASTAEFLVTLKKGADGEKEEAKLRKFGTKNYPDTFTVHALTVGPPAGGFQLNVNGDDPAKIAQVATKIDELMHKNAKKWELVEISSQAATMMPQLVAQLKPDAPLSAAAFERALSGVLKPIPITELGDENPLTVMVDPRAASTPKTLGALMLPMSDGTQKPLAAVATIKQVEVPVYLNRVNGTLSGRVSARMLGADTAGVTRDIRTQVEKLDLPKGVSLDWDQGEAQFVDQMFVDMSLAMLVAIILVFFVLVLFFGSLVFPFAILAPVLFSFIGSFGALIITGRALGLPAMIGQLLLIGIIVSNSILLVDATLRLRRQGVKRDEALLRAAKLRVRPVLMTATATIAALLPLSLGVSGEGGLISSTLGTVVIGGLLVATLLTLVIVPSVYRMFDRDKDMTRETQT